MKTIPVSLVVAGILAPVASLVAQDDHNPQRRQAAVGGGMRGAPCQMGDAWKSADTNHDEVISQEEFETMPRIQNLPEEKRQPLFKRLDKDSDGKISREELGRIGQHRDGAERPRQRLWELDVDHSGGISLEEFKVGPVTKKLPVERQDELFRRLDTDRDGMITPKDRPEQPHKRDGGARHQKRPDGEKSDVPRFEARQIIRQLDQNNDGSLSFEEFRAGQSVKDWPEADQKTRFDALDRNHDQKLTHDDFAPPGPRGEMKRSQDPPPTPSSAPVDAPAPHAPEHTPAPHAP